MNYRFIAQLILQDQEQKLLSREEIDLLKEVDRRGQLRQAALAIGISYKKAWLLIERVNNLSPAPLVERFKGGAQGGGSRLTPLGQRLIQVFESIDQLANNLLDSFGGDLSAPQHFLQGLSMKISTRNQFSGKIIALDEGPIFVQVTLQLSGKTQITATITHHALEDLHLSLNKEVFAAIKASNVILAKSDAPLNISTGNQLEGQVVELFEGQVHYEVILSLEGGNHVCATLPVQALTELAPRIGDKLWVLFQPSDVILITL
ncbi:MAG: TOBE domain-containing protein [bacterium]|nr:TOBE domain-containing protein [bacterium]